MPLFTDGFFCHLQKFSMHSISPNKLLSFLNFLRLLPGVKAKIPGGTFNVEVIQVCSSETFLENPKRMLIESLILKPCKVPKLLAQYPNKYKFLLKIFWKLLIFT